jgi:hypothetical protein
MGGPVGRKGTIVAIKDSAETWVRGKPTAAMILVAAIGVVVGGVLGLGAGYKIEQNRTSSDVAKLKNELKAKGVQNTAAPLGQRVGKVTAVTSNSISVQTPKQGVQEMRTSSATQVEKTAAAKTSDIAVGKRILVTISGTDVIILPTGSKLGRVVSIVSKGSFQIRTVRGKNSPKLALNNVKHVSTLTAAKLSDVKTGSGILAGGRSTSNKKVFAASEIILLPTGSGFAT